MNATSLRNAARAVGFALIVPSLASGATYVAWPVFRSEPLALLYGAVAVAAFEGGLRFGLLATAASFVLGQCVILANSGSIDSEIGPGRGAIPFVAGAFLICLLGEAHRLQGRSGASESAKADSMFEQIGDAVILVDEWGRVTFMNTAAERLTGNGLRASIRKPVAEVLRLLDRTTRRPVAPPTSGTSAAVGDRVPPGEYYVMKPDQEEIPIECRIVARGEGMRQPNGWAVILREIARSSAMSESPRHLPGGLDGGARRRAAELSEINDALELEVERRVRAEKALQGANQLLQALVSASPLAIITLDPRNRVTTWNTAAERMFGWNAPEVLGRILPNSDDAPRAVLGSGFGESSRESGLAGFETRRRMKDGFWVEVEIWTAPVYDDVGKYTARLGIIADIRERKRIEEERANLLRRLVTSQEEERHRIARELHDQMGQHLTALTLGLRALERLDNSTERAQGLLHLHSLMDQIGQDAHRIALELRPTALDDLGLHSAVSNYLEDWSERSGVEIDFESRGIEHCRLDSEVETALYRIIQEALTNVAKHANAAHVGLVLEHSHNQVLVIIEDDGDGFDLDGLVSTSRVGLVGMRERATLIGGSVAIESSPGGGTTVLVRVPNGVSTGFPDHAV